MSAAPAPFQRPPGKIGQAVAAYKRWPKWGQIAAPVGALVLFVGAAGAGAEEGPRRDSEAQDNEAVAFDDVTTERATPTIDDAVEVASEHAPTGVSDAELAGLITMTCEGIADGPESGAQVVADSLAVSATSAEQQADLANAVGDGAEVLCPEEVAGSPQFMNHVVRLAAVQVTTTAPPTTAAPTTTPPTAPPTTLPPVTAPPPTAPPATAPPVTAPPSPPPAAGVYYENCDAARAVGAAPVHVGDPGYRPALDRDGDGIGCE